MTSSFTPSKRPKPKPKGQAHPLLDQLLSLLNTNERLAATHVAALLGNDSSALDQLPAQMEALQTRRPRPVPLCELPDPSDIPFV